MKRLFSFLAVFVLALTLAVPASATDEYTLSGRWLIDPVVSTTGVSGFLPLAAVEFTSNSTSYNEMFWSYWDLTFRNNANSTPDVVVAAKNNNYTMLPEYRHIDFGDTPQVVPADFYNWFVSTALDLDHICDGSACSAWDENLNGRCDECGFTLMNLTRSPIPPTVEGNNLNEALFYSGTLYKYSAYTSDSSYTISGRVYGSRYRSDIEPKAVNVRVFESYDGLNWNQTYNDNSATDYPGEVGWELIDSSFDWYDEEGNRFFPVPLWEEILEVTQGEMTGLTAETGGTMRVLVLSGVGLMALLVVLSLFGKRLLLFLR